MLTDAHCHPYDLVRVFPECERERQRLGVLAAANACSAEEFAYNEKLSRLSAAGAAAAKILPCFAVHPQQFQIKNEPLTEYEARLAALEDFASQGRIAAVGECGFDLYNSRFKETEAIQEKFFAAHLEIALRYSLPVVLHVRRAMHKIFAAAKTLAKCKSVIFHSWPGTFEEGNALLRRGVNAYFSFGNVILKDHKQAIRSCALFPAERLLTETDAPYQPARGQSFSHWEDLPRIIEAAAVIRGNFSQKEGIEAENGGTGCQKLEAQIEANFKAAFCLSLDYPTVMPHVKT